ncbi:hypothetical protein HMPREF1415_00314 [Helicobacter pylori GAM254Ai]|nr:hypothetical protein HMPREF1415_00314 [Helicobacter pylori GAM254Ai]
MFVLLGKVFVFNEALVIKSKNTQRHFLQSNNKGLAKSGR